MIKILSTYLLFSIISWVIVVIATFILTHLLSPAEYGIGMLLFSTLELVAMLCCMGMDRVFLRYCYEKEYHDQTSFLLYCCLLFTGIGVFILFTIGLFFVNSLNPFFHLNGWLIWWLMVIGTIAFILEIFTSLMPRLNEKPSLYSIGQIVQQTTFLISIILLILFWKKNSLVIITGQILGLSACSIVLIYFYKDNWVLPKKILQKIKLTDVKKILYYGFPFSFSSSLAWIFFNIDKFLLLKWSNADTLGIYTAAFVLSTPLEAFRTIFILAWVPRCNQLLVETPFKGKKIFHDTFHQVLWGFTIIDSVLLLSKSLLILWLGSEFYTAEKIFGWLLLSIYFYALSEIVTAGILKSKKTYWNIIISVLCLLTNIIACYYLIPYFGALGAALSNVFSFGLFFLARYIIGFYYYPFKIFRWKLFLYVFYLCGMTILTNYNYIDWQLMSFSLFLLLSCWLERKWLISIPTTLQDAIFNTSS